MTRPWLLALKSPLFHRAAQASLLLVVAVLVAFTFVTVPLTPHVDQTFFFADDDPQLEQDRKIGRIFPQQDQIIINIQGKISSPAYLSKIGTLTDRLLKVPGVVTAKSLTHGPKDFNDALTSEFWGRTLIPQARDSSNVFVILGGASSRRAIPEIEAIVSQSETGSFRPIIAGVPYMIELIQRRLMYDVKVFSLCAVTLFGLVVVFIFSWF
jgi:predicted RND superfamily exporter protein